MRMMGETKRIVILGAGFAGFHAALEFERTLARDPSVDVVLVTPQNFQVFTPMLHEVAAGALDPHSVVVPIRESLRHVRLLQAQATAVDFENRAVTVAYGLDRRTRNLRFDHLLIAAGAQTRFPPELRRHVHGMKTIHDALVLRNWLVALLERAEIEEDPAQRRALLTIVVAGGGFSGVETISSINDFLRELAPQYPRVGREVPKLVLVDRNERLLPEFDPGLGDYTAEKLRAAGIDVRLRTQVSTFNGRTLWLEGRDESRAPAQLLARTLVWTAGVAPSAVVDALALGKDRGRIFVDATLAVPGYGGVWACGDCAAVLDPRGKPYPGTAQHAVHQGRQAARNIAAAVRQQPERIRPFRYQMRGQFATIGRRNAVATLFGLKFSGFVAWLLWRGAYLLMLPGANRKLRVFLQWALELGFPRDSVQLLTAQSVVSRRLEELMDSARAAEAADGAMQR
jgi:NADH:ubiquinone reductase (H+-translocating)